MRKNSNQNNQYNDQSEGKKKGGFMKILLPLIAAILILGAIAIFGGMALNNHNDSKSDDQK